MSSTGSGSGSGSTWLSLIEDKRISVNHQFGQGYRAPADINNGRSFRGAIEKFCESRRDLKVPKLETKLIRPFTAITSLARAVGQSIEDLQTLAPNDTPEGLIWWTSFALIDCGCQAGAQLVHLVELIAMLNKKVPIFAPHGRQFNLRFPSEKRVQKPLQDIYSLFIDANLFIISRLRNCDPEHNVDPTKDEELTKYIENTAKRLEEARGRYDLMASQAAEDEEREKANLEQPSLEAQRSLPDHLHSNSNTGREVYARFVSVKVLGKGSFGEVDEVRESTTGAAYARKHIHLDNSRAQKARAKEVQNEVAVMQKLRHLHIATVLFYLQDNDDTYSIFMLPVADYDLHKFLKECTKEEYPAAMTKLLYPWFGCLLDALAYAHKLKIKHRDIKPSNILIKNQQPYLCDFGLAKDFAETDASASRGDVVQGTKLYRAPEVIAGRPRGRKADVFALGSVYSEMFTVARGKSLKEYEDARKEEDSIAFRDCLPNVERWLRSFESTRLNDLLADQILGMMRQKVDEPNGRLTAEKALHHLKHEPALFCVE